MIERHKNILLCLMKDATEDQIQDGLLWILEQEAKGWVRTTNDYQKIQIAVKRIMKKDQQQIESAESESIHDSITERDINQAIARSVIETLMEKLSDVDKQIITLRFYEGLSLEEVYTIVNRGRVGKGNRIGFSRVQSREYQAIAKMRMWAKNQGLDASVLNLFD